MKNINISNLDLINNPQSFVEYEIMNWENKEVLSSLDNPETSEDALKIVSQIIDKKTKFSNNIPLEDNVIYRIIAEAFLNNRKIEDQLNIFYQQISPKVAQARVEAWFVVWAYANRAYKPENNINFDSQKVA